MSTEAQPAYEGLVTRAIAFAIDAAIINGVAIVVSAGVALALSILSVSDERDTVLVVIGSVAFVLWSVGYFVTFWSSTGQTPGNRVMRVRVCQADNGLALRPVRAVVRFGAMVLAALPLLAGFLTIPVDARRRGLHDMIAGTVVVSAPDVPAPGYSSSASPGASTRTSTSRVSSAT